MSERSFDATDPRVELEVLRERLKNAEEKIRQLEESLRQAYTELGWKEAELGRIREERDDLKVKWEVAKVELKHKQELLALSNQKAKKKKGRSIRYNVFGNMLICFAGVLVAFGSSTLATTSPSSSGWLEIATAVVIYLVGAIFIATRGGN